MLKRYRIVFISLLFLAALTVYDLAMAQTAVDTSMSSFKQLLLVLPPIFIILGILDVWVPKETMVKFMGKEAGVKGVILAFFLGSTAAGPLYGAFPVAAVLMKKGAWLFNILVFIGAWSTTKIPMFMFEVSAFGTKFALTRLLINIPIIMLVAFILNKSLTKEEVADITMNMAALSD